MTINIFTDELDLEKIRTIKLQGALRKFAVTVAGRSLDLKIETDPFRVPSGNPPAWSMADQIGLFHKSETPIMDLDSLLRLKGLTIHELGHVIFTPRDRTHMVKTITADGMHKAFNILEDNRIDNLMVARLSGVAPWLLHAVFVEFFSTPDGHEYLLPLLHGRKYVPQNIRDLSAKVYHDQGNVGDIKRIIDTYIQLNMARKEHQATGLSLVQELHWLLSDATPTTSHGHYEVCSPEKNGGQDVAGIREQDEALQRADKQQAQQSATESATEPAPVPASNAEAKQQMDEQVQEARSRVAEEVYEDIKDMVQGMRKGGGAGGGGEDKSVTPAKGVWLADVAPDMRMNTRHFTRILQELKALHDPSWVSNESEGRLNARQFLMGADLDQSFDLWDNGREDASDIECVILLDISGSMHYMLSQAYDAMWGIKRSLDSINASTTVITFGDYSRVLYEADSRAGIRRKHSMDGMGGTQPLSGLKRSRDIFFSSLRAVKLFIVITDGQWSNKVNCDAIVTEMKLGGVLTGLVHLESRGLDEMEESEYAYHIDTHGCEVVKVLDNPHDITDFARQIVNRQQQLVLQS